VLSDRTDELSTVDAGPRSDRAATERTEGGAASADRRPVDDGQRDRRPRRTAQAPPPPRRSRVVVRSVDTWSVLKISLLFYLSVFVVLLVASMLLWAAASAIGIVENIESFMDSIGFTDFSFEAGQLLRGSALGGAVLVVAGTFGNVVMAVLYNLISEVVGGLRITLGEDETARRVR
jgi:hypothetical protein